MTEIQSLTLRAQDLNQSVNWWNAAMIWALVFVAVAAIAVVVTTRIALTRAKQLADTQEQLLRAKDAQLAHDLKDKDVQISGASDKAAQASDSAAKAEAKAEGFRLAIVQANERAAEANRIAEEERLARVKIEERLASRRIGEKQHAELVAVLKQYRGAVVEVTKLGDFEAGQFADDLLSVLAEAGWNVQLSVVGVYAPPTYGLTCAVNDSTAAGKALVAAIRSLPTSTVEAGPNLPINARIFVGLKPPT